MTKQARDVLWPALAFWLLVATADAQSNFSNGFEAGNDTGWNVSASSVNNATPVTSGTDNITAATGGWFALAPQNAYEASPPGSAQTQWGGYSSHFGGGFATSVDIYLSVAGDVSSGTPVPWANDTRFAWDSAVTDSAGGFLRDFVFNAGFYTATPATGTPGFVIDAENNTGRGSSFPQDPAYSPYTITNSGWYTFSESFFNNGGFLDVTMSILDAEKNVLTSWNVDKGQDAIASVGGNNYGWFASNEFSVLAFDNTSLTYINGGQPINFNVYPFSLAAQFDPSLVVPEPSALAIASQFAVGAALLAWRLRRRTRVSLATAG